MTRSVNVFMKAYSTASTTVCWVRLFVLAEFNFKGE